MQQPTKSNKKCWMCCSITLIILGLALIIQVFFIPDTLTTILHNEVTNRLVMKPSMADPSDKYHDYWNIWSDQKSEDAGISLFKYFLFNTTNPYNAANSIELPNITVIGPFTFRRYELKNNITFVENNEKVFYTNTYQFVFEPDLSTKDANLGDYVYAISSQMIAFLQNAENTIFTYPDAMNAILTWPAEYIYAHETIETLLTGYIDKRVEDITGDITGYNNSIAYINDDPISIQEWTGHPDDYLAKIRELIEYRGSPYQQWGYQGGLESDPFVWYEYVNGSRESGRQWRPENTISKDDILEIFAPEKFRKVKYKFDRETERDGLKLYRYRIMDDEWFTTALHNTSVNWRYGQSADYGVLNDGVMRLDLTRPTVPDLSDGGTSNIRVPIMMSKGLFKDAPFYMENITLAYGLPEPDEDFDEQYIEIEPISGTAFRVMNTYMISLRSDPLKDYLIPYLPGPSNFSNLTSLWYPQQYTSAEAFAQDKTVDFFVNNLNRVNMLKNFSIYGGIVIGIFCLIIAFVIYYKKLKVSSSDNYNLMMSDKYGQPQQTNNNSQYGSMKGIPSDDN